MLPLSQDAIKMLGVASVCQPVAEAKRKKNISSGLSIQIFERKSKFVTPAEAGVDACDP